MIKLIVGNKGSGKTKILIDMINHSLQTSDGNVVCIERGPKLTYDIHSVSSAVCWQAITTSKTCM